MLNFLTKIGKSLMFPIATLPAAALLVRFGQPDMLDLPFLAAAGDGILGHLPIIFAIGIAMGLAFDGSGGAALAGAVAYLVLNSALESVDKNINMGVFGGIISGIIAGTLYNKFYNIKFPEWLAFFGGRRFVPIITAAVMTILASILVFVWPPVQSVIDAAGNWVLDAGMLGVGAYGFLNRLLIPTGLHHVINTVVWFDFGSFTDAGGKIVKGEINRFLAGDPTAGPFLSGFFPIMMFGLPAACLAMYAAAKKEKRSIVGGMFVSIALTAFLTGVTEPIEFSFMFLSPILYIVHALLTGISMMISYGFGVHDGFGFSAGFSDYILNFGIATKPLLLIPIGLFMSVLYFVIFYFLIIKLDLKTPGREDDEDGEVNVGGTEDEVLDAKAFYTIEGLGGKENIVAIDYCTTRLRLTLKDAGLVNEQQLKKYGARGLKSINKTNVQVIIGTAVEFLADAMKSRIAKGNPPLQHDVVLEDNVSIETGEKLKSEDFEMPMTGEIISLIAVPDQVFSSGMMGPGFGIKPTEGIVCAPFDGKVLNVFQTKHAIALLSDTGVEVLIHIGLDTVKLKGEGFELLVGEGQIIQRGDQLLKIDLEYIDANSPSTVTPVIFTNSQDKTITILKQGIQSQGTSSIIDLKSV
ncbi:PTS transporter subunit EIIC [Viridibacillus sp. YIM B01967]|uniref:PTS transporter subunit EIIC n=1 Tax=Viridibacillus soli TaxID=2798301 RepID=A0ABS1H1Z8_9BACL|nr:N-acetylglucosamine-specific PTS transporter subunit IIBC [Viridibacillus soli]MBK3493399.1 PTS transporter subunit EIIC [Viridibacillus soli]